MVGVGENLRDQYQLGDRFIVQADIYVDGVNYAYGYMIQGGLSQYGVIDQRILNGDDGNYLIPVQPDDRLCRERADRAVGLRHRRLRACSTAPASSRAARLDHRHGRRGMPGARATTPSAPALMRNRHPARLLLTNVPRGLRGLAARARGARWASR